MLVRLYKFPRIKKNLRFIRIGLSKDRTSAVYFLGFVVQCIKWGIDERRATLYQFPCRTHTNVHFEISFL